MIANDGCDIVCATERRKEGEGDGLHHLLYESEA
jgi:hypothetical protein